MTRKPQIHFPTLNTQLPQRREKFTQTKKRCLTLEEAFKYFHKIGDDDISELISQRLLYRQDFTIPLFDEMMDEEDFDENVLYIGENLEKSKDITGEIEII
ncbi:hypothetical protein TNIN_340791 [Trichonephila inaurata madagascariensis]|uniref:Uncharacterized protein n=1 Tax=Trichonephila inaurata madagascariensis TaxID=2747483 RepID=A0A8X6Y0F3_9ARAC|nr:hypothetical protein TNIN_340791 [Trichonephila inaurata madagascariensis]